jgi:small subunit ribosomal protein S23
MTFKNQPKQVIKTTRKLFESRILPRIPAWFSAAEKYPNNTSYYRGPSSILPDPKDASITTTRQTILSSTTTAANVKGKGSSRKTKFVPPVPPKLVYPEDALRQRFFKDHPFELHRPISLVERKTVDDGWKAMISGDASRRVTVQE